LRPWLCPRSCCREAYNAPPEPLAEFKGEGGQGVRGRREEGKRGEERGGERNGKKGDA